MSISFRALIRSFRYAFRGLQFVWMQEQNFRIQTFVAMVVVVGMIIFHVHPWEAIALIFVMTMVLIMELLNTIVEHIIDILKPRLHHYIGTLKDMMAAAVVLASFAAVIVGVIIFLPYFISLF